MSFSQFIQDYRNQGLASPEEWEIEKIDEKKAVLWFKENSNLPFQLCGLYLIVVFGGKYIMDSRPKFDLRIPLMCWSALLAIFSVIGSVRCWVIFSKLYEADGVSGLICGNSFYVSPIGKFWGFIFCLSKAPELIDTIFIVLRKQKLIFLHWYHHITVLLFSWHCYEGHRAGGGVFMVMNLVVHAMMYSYYACRAAKVKVPRFIALIITTSQILQMFLGVATFCMLYLWRNDKGCQSDNRHLLYGGLMYFSYLVLFCHFFYGAYINPSRPKVVSKGDEQISENVSKPSLSNGNTPHPVENSQNGSNLRSRKAVRTS